MKKREGRIWNLQNNAKGIEKEECTKKENGERKKKNIEKCILEKGERQEKVF
jgi:hypothetical protein